MEVEFRCAAPVYGFICLLSPGVWVRILNIISFPRSMGMIYASLSYFSVFLLSLAFARVMGHFFNQSFDCPSDARNRSAAHLYLTSIWRPPTPRTWFDINCVASY